MRYAIKTKKVTKAFQDRAKFMPKWLVSNSHKNKFFAVKDVSLKIGKGEIFGILGPNGCGKSTVIRMMTTLLVPDSGEITVGGHNVIEKPEEVKKIINRVSVEASFFKRLSARENLLYASRLYGLEDKKSTEKFVSILKELKFDTKKIDDPMMDFSRGMQQKVAIARGFITKPEIIMLDEPTTGLDPKSKLDVQEFIKKVHDERNLTIVLSSHDMSEVETLCHKIAIMDKGKVIALGTSEELKRMIADKDIYELETSENRKASKLIKKIPEISEIKIVGGSIQFHTKDINAIADRITTMLRENNTKFRHLKKVVPTLEDVFLKLTGKSLEEE